MTKAGFNPDGTRVTPAQCKEAGHQSMRGFGGSCCCVHWRTVSFNISPGSWRYMDDGYIVSEDGEGCLVAKVETENAESADVVRADGLLLAASPDLLRAAEDTLEALEEYQQKDADCLTVERVAYLCGKLSAAIARTKVYP